jgi:hypothetical protein
VAAARATGCRRTTWNAVCGTPCYGWTMGCERGISPWAAMAPVEKPPCGQAVKRSRGSPTRAVDSLIPHRETRALPVVQCARVVPLHRGDGAMAQARWHRLDGALRSRASVMEVARAPCEVTPMGKPASKV